MARWPSTPRPDNPAAQFILDWLADTGASQVELSAMIGGTKQRVNQIIGGRYRMTPDTVARLAIAMGVDPVWLYRLQGDWEVRQAVRAVMAGS